jgi:hypothetical protein
MELGAEESSENFYHERQHFQFCLLHCLNNLFQVTQWFSLPSAFSAFDSCNVMDFATRASLQMDE